MTIYDRPDEKVMAEGALAGEVQAFPDILRGWGIAFDQTGGFPPMEWFNALAKRGDQSVRYFMQRGLPEWSGTEDYPQGAYIQYAGNAYVSKRANANKPPATSPNDWSVWALTQSQILALVGPGRLLRTTVYTRVGGVQMVSVDGAAPTAVGASTYSAAMPNSVCLAEIQAGGGGGAGAPSTSSASSASGGGGAGSFATAIFAAPATPIAISVGLGGAGGVNTSAGTSGGASSIGSIVTCPGGPGSLASSPGAGLAGGTAYSAAPTGANLYSQVGGGGSYGIQLSTNSGIGGPGGASRYGAGANGPNATTSNGNAAVNFGAGGSGATSGAANTGGATGGAGASGIIIVREYAGT